MLKLRPVSRAVNRRLEYRLLPDPRRLQGDNQKWSQTKGRMTPARNEKSSTTYHHGAHSTVASGGEIVPGGTEAGGGVGELGQGGQGRTGSCCRSQGVGGGWGGIARSRADCGGGWREVVLLVPDQAGRPVGRGLRYRDLINEPTVLPGGGWRQSFSLAGNGRTGEWGNGRRRSSG